MTNCEIEGCTTQGGKFLHRGGKWICEFHVTSSGYVDVAKTTFPFTTTHIDGSKITVQNLRHLRRLENTYGVSSVAYNDNSRNWGR